MDIVILGEEAKAMERTQRVLEACLDIAPNSSSDIGRYVITRITIPVDYNKKRSLFQEAVSKLTSPQYHEATIVVPDIDPFDLNPLRNLGFPSLVAMLILALPEQRFMFSSPSRSTNLDEKEFERFCWNNDIRLLSEPLQNSIYDGAGLRNWVKERMMDYEDTRSDAAHLTMRMNLAVALDEETDYANLHAYTAYRFGFRSYSLSSKANASCLLTSCNRLEQPKLTFEDLYLNLPDGNKKYSWLAPGKDGECSRDKDFPRLKEADYRVIVTSGQQKNVNDDRDEANHRCFENQRRSGRYIEKIRKPHSGIFHVWDESNLNEKLTSNVGNAAAYLGTGEGYIWPPNWSAIEGKKKSNATGHSSQGILTQIASHLVNRASNIFEKNVSLDEDIRGAVLAMDALELLGGKTPTLSAQALTLKHQFEVRAVCHFAGVEHHIPMEARWKEIRRDSEAIAIWVEENDKQREELNIQMDIANELVRLLRNENQFDEEQFWMQRARSIHNTLWLNDLAKVEFRKLVLEKAVALEEMVTGLILRIKAKCPNFREIYRALCRLAKAENLLGDWISKLTLGKIASYLLRPGVRYCEFLLSSLTNFLAATAGWIASFAVVFIILNSGFELSSNDHDPITQALFSFLAGEPPTYNDRPAWIAVSSLAALIGVAHIGIFISHLYSIINRK